MSEELIDLRAKITAETDTWLTAEAHARRCTKAEVVRDALHELAQAKIHAAIIIARMVLNKGGVGALEGLQGRDP